MHATAQPSLLHTPQMEEEVYDLLDSSYETYWRYLTRHRLLHWLWKRHRETRGKYKVLDVGCGPGGLLAYFQKRDPVLPVGIDLYFDALRRCRRRRIGTVAAAQATSLPFNDNSFDLVTTQDVLIYLEDDDQMLREMNRVCSPGGIVLACAPAMKSLWSNRDIRMSHRRRYALRGLVQQMRVAGFDIVHSTHTDMFLAPPLWAAVKLAPRNEQGLANLGTDNVGESPLANRLLTLVANSESLLSRHLRLPLGVSALVVGRKPHADQLEESSCRKS